MYKSKLLASCLLIAGLVATSAEARPGYLGAYRVCGYTYVEAMERCSNAFVITSTSVYRIQIGRLGADGWIDDSPALSARKVVRQYDWNWIYYRIRYG